MKGNKRVIGLLSDKVLTNTCILLPPFLEERERVGDKEESLVPVWRSPLIPKLRGQRSQLLVCPPPHINALPYSEAK